jgi:hypothetical protein
MIAPINVNATNKKPPLIKIYLAVLCSNKEIMASPQNGQRPERNPAVAPQARSVLCAQSAGHVDGESARYIPRFAAIINDKRKDHP